MRNSRFIKKISFSIIAFLMSFSIINNNLKASDKKNLELSLYGGGKALFLNKEKKFMNNELFYRNLGGLFGVGLNNHFFNRFKFSGDGKIEGSITEIGDAENISKAYETILVLTTNLDFYLKNRFSSDFYIGPYLGHEFQKVNYQEEHDYKGGEGENNQKTLDNSLFFGLGMDIGRFEVNSYYKKNMNNNFYSSFGYGIMIKDLFNLGIGLSLKREHNILNIESKKLYYQNTDYNMNLILGLDNGYSIILGGGKTYYNHEKIPFTYYLDLFLKKKF